MRPFEFVFILACPIFFSCSTPSSREPLTISRIESIGYGASSADEVAKILGKPDAVIPLKDGNEIWSYKEADATGDRGQRLNLRIDRASSHVIAATWIPFQGETLNSKEGVLARFKNSNFKKKAVGWDSGQHHHFSNDEIYADEQRGISFYLNTHQNTVEDVSFKAALPSRALGTAVKATEQQ